MREHDLATHSASLRPARFFVRDSLLHEEALAHHRLGAQGFDEVGGVGDPSEHPLQNEERGVVVASGQSLADWLGRAIGQEHAPEISEHGVPHRRFDADAGGAASEDQVLNSQTAQDQLQVRAIEPAEAVFGDDNIPWLRHELAHNLGVPGIANHDMALGAIGRGDPFANATPFKGDPVWRVDGTKIGEVKAVFRLEVDDLHARLACGGQNSRRRDDGLAYRGNVYPGAVEHSALGPEVVLHIDHDDGRSGQVDGGRLRLRLNHSFGVH